MPKTIHRRRTLKEGRAQGQEPAGPQPVALRHPRRRQRQGPADEFRRARPLDWTGGQIRQRRQAANDF